jgi:hypothetical protein
MVPGVRIEVMAIRTAVAITTDGDIGIATLKGARQHTVEQTEDNNIGIWRWPVAAMNLGAVLSAAVQNVTAR